MKKLCLVLVVSWLAVGCQQSDDTAPETPAEATPADTGTTEAAPADAQGQPEAQAEASSEAPASDLETRLDTVLAGVHRSEEHRARDRYRNPQETLAFFGLEHDARVMEINPGGGWYLEVLAPLVGDAGRYIAATPDPEIEGMPEYFIAHAEGIEERIELMPELFGNVQVNYYDPAELVLGEPESVDFVLTFRNVHGWLAHDMAEGMFAAFFDVLAPGGTLGVVQHRAPEGADSDATAESGYVSEQTVIELAESVGFTLVESSEINANPADTADHPQGVWTLPPVLALGDDNREHWLGIGESDRMTLRFTKPAE